MTIAGYIVGLIAMLCIFVQPVLMWLYTRAPLDSTAEHRIWSLGHGLLLLSFVLIFLGFGLVMAGGG